MLVDRNNLDSVSYLFDFIVDSSLSDPVSNEEVDAIQAVMLKLSPEKLLQSAARVPDRVLSPKLFVPVKKQLFKADTQRVERDRLIGGLLQIETTSSETPTYVLEILAEVIANQMYVSELIEFLNLPKMQVFVAKAPSKDDRNFRPSGYGPYDGKLKSEANLGPCSRSEKNPQ